MDGSACDFQKPVCFNGPPKRVSPPYQPPGLKFLDRRSPYEASAVLYLQLSHPFSRKPRDAFERGRWTVKIGLVNSHGETDHRARRKVDRVHQQPTYRRMRR